MPEIEPEPKTGSYRAPLPNSFRLLPGPPPQLRQAPTGAPSPAQKGPYRGPFPSSDKLLQGPLPQVRQAPTGAPFPGQAGS